MLLLKKLTKTIAREAIVLHLALFPVQSRPIRTGPRPHVSVNRADDGPRIAIADADYLEIPGFGLVPATVSGYKIRLRADPSSITDNRYTTIQSIYPFYHLTHTSSLYIYIYIHKTFL